MDMESSVECIEMDKDTRLNSIRCMYMVIEFYNYITGNLRCVQASALAASVAALAASFSGVASVVVGAAEGS
jgi:hypothetical protein